MEWFIRQADFPVDLKVVAANAGLSRRYESESERALQLLYELLERVEKGECDNGDIAECALRAHIACIYCHKGDLEKAREVLTPALRYSQTVSDYAVIKAGWVHGWLLFLEGQQGLEVFSANFEDGIDDVISQVYAMIQKEDMWFRNTNENFQLMKADIHLRLAKRHIVGGESRYSKVVRQLLQKAWESLDSIVPDHLLKSHRNEPYTTAYHNQLRFMYYHLQGNPEAQVFLRPAVDNWKAAKCYKYTSEIAEMANDSHLLQELPN